MIRPGKDRSKDVAALLILVLVLLVVRWDVVVHGHVPTRGDTMTGFLPHKSFLARTVGEGELPLWNPHMLAGQPFLADPQTAVFSPFTLPFHVLPLVPAFIAYILLKHLLAGAFTYGFLRCIGANRPGALLGAVAFTFSSTMYRQIPWQEVGSTTVWLPLLFWLSELLIRNPRRVRIAFLAAWIFAFENLAGHPQVTYYIYLSLGMYCMVRLVANAILKRSAAPFLTSAPLILGALVIGAGISMIQVLPLREFMETTRYGVDFSIQEAARPATRPGEIPGVFLGGVYPGYEDHINTSYVGILPLMFLVGGVLTRGIRTAAFILIGAFAVLLALGLDGPLFAPLYHALPGFRQLHGPVRILPVATFVAALLAGVGASRVTDRFTPPPGARRRIARPAAVVLIGVTGAWFLYLALARTPDLPFSIRNLLSVGFPSMALLALFAAGWIRRRGFVVAMLLVTAADLAHFTRVRYPDIYGDPGPFVRRPPSVKFLEKDPEIARAVGFTNGITVPKRVEIPERLVRQQVSTIFPNLSLHMGTHDAQAVYSLKNERFTQYVEALNGPERGGRWILPRLTLLGNPFSRLFDLLNVKYVLTVESNPLPIPAPLEEIDGAFPLVTDRPVNGIVLEFEAPLDGTAPPSVPVEIASAGGPIHAFEVVPGDDPVPALSAFREHRRALSPAEPEPYPEASRFPEDCVVIDGDGAPSLQSTPVPEAQRMRVTFEATSLERDGAGVTCSLLDATTGEVLYQALVGAEGYSALYRRDRGVASSQRVRTRRGIPLRVTFSREGHGLELTVNGISLVRYRDVDPLPAREVRVAFGARGGDVAIRNVEVAIPAVANRRRLVRAVVELPRYLAPVSVRLPDGEVGGRLVAVTLLDTQKFTRVFRDGDVSIYRNRDCRPRAFLAGGHRVVESPDETLRILERPGFDPAAEVLLPVDPELERPEGPRTLTDATAEIVEYRANRVTIRTESPDASILVLTDVMYPGWKVFVDGRPAGILRANHAFRAVALLPGEHQVEFRYGPRSFRTGATLSGACLLVWCVLVAAAGLVRRARRARRSR